MANVDKTHKLSVTRQCELLNVPRSSFYYSPCKNNSYNEELMKLIDEQYTVTPFYGVPRMVAHLRGLGHKINPKRIRRLYRQMDLHAMGPRPNTSIPHRGNGHSVYPYLLRGYKVNRPNQVWAMDITYVPIDSKSRAIDNIFNLEPSSNGLELYHKIKDYMKFYNAERPHQSLEYKTPEQMYLLVA